MPNDSLQEYVGLNLEDEEVQLKRSHQLTANPHPLFQAEWYIVVRGQLQPGFFNIEDGAKRRRAILETPRGAGHQEQG